MSLDELDKQAATFYLILLINILSILSSLFIIIVYIYAKGLRVYAFRLVLYLSISDLFKSASMLIPTYSCSSSSIQCIIQSTSYQFFTISSIQMSLLMALCLYLSIIKNIEDIEKYHKYFISFILILASTSSLLIYLLGMSGRYLYWCSVGESFYYFHLLVFFIPLWVVNFCNFYLYFAVISKMRKEFLDVKRLKFYPFVLVFCYLPATLAMVFIIIGEEVPFGLVVVVVLCDGALGLMNCLLYGLTKYVKVYIRASVSGDKNVFVFKELSDLNSFSNFTLQTMSLIN